MKKYHLHYEFLGDKREFKTESLFEFSIKLDELIEDPHVPDDTVKLWTEDI